MVHPHGTGDTVVLIAHVVGDDLVTAATLHRLALAHRARSRVVFLAVLLDLVAGVAATHRAGNRCQRTTLAVSDLVTQQAARHRANGGTGDLMLVPHRHVAGHDL